jgi:hypothetical protein
LNAHPVTATGRQVIWLQRFKRKFSFLGLDIPSMSNTALLRVFRYRYGITTDARRWAGKAQPQNYENNPMQSGKGVADFGRRAGRLRCNAQ